MHPQRSTDERHFVRLPPSHPPVLMVVVDTEEEFDWSAPFDRGSTSVTAMREVWRLQAVFDEFDIVPVYVIDYPVATQADGIDPLKAFQDDGRAVIGAHLHPWVSPPHREKVSRQHSFPGNLEPALESEKLAILTQSIETNFGRRPTIYKAGRYGFGENTATILRAQHYEIDISPSPPFDFSAEGGPDFSSSSCDSFWLGEPRQLLGIPNSGGFVGGLRRLGRRLHPMASDPRLRWTRLRGMLSRLRLLDRIRLSPEGFDVNENLRLTRTLLADGVRTFTFSLHSPSAKPGCTPYVRSADELGVFLEGCRRYFAAMLGQIGAVAMNPNEYRERLIRDGIEAS